jgi:cytochrome P450
MFDTKKLPLHIDTVRRIGKEYGDVAKYTFGNSNFYYLSNPSHFKKFLVTDWKKYGRDPLFQSANRFKKLGMFSLNPGDEWKRHRNLLNASFSDVNLKKEFETNIDKITNDLIKRWEVAADKKENLNASKDFGALTLDAIGISGFGREFKIIENQDYKYADIIAVLFETLIWKILLPTFAWSLPFAFMKKVNKTESDWDLYLNDIINTRKKELQEKDSEGFTIEKTDILSKMMKSHVQDENPFDQDELLSNTNDLIAAGHET